MKQDYIKEIKTYKIIQLVFFAIIDISFLICILTNRAIHDYIFSNPALLIFGSIAWIILIASILFLILDLRYILQINIENHDLNTLAFLDSLTGIPNRVNLDKYFEKFNTPEKLENLGCVLLQISNLSELNDTLGRDEGDIKLRDFCDILSKVSAEYGIIGRNGGNEFLCIMENCTDKMCDDFLYALDSALSLYNVTHDGAPIGLRCSRFINTAKVADNVGDVIAHAYKGIR